MNFISDWKELGTSEDFEIDGTFLPFSVPQNKTLQGSSSAIRVCSGSGASTERRR